MRYESSDYVFLNSGSIVTRIKCLVFFGRYKMRTRLMDPKGDPKVDLSMEPKMDSLQTK